jgi:predicted ATPase
MAVLVTIASARVAPDSYTMLQTLAIANYRSVRHLVLPLARLNVVTGANGSGKSNLYRALRLLGEAARGGIVGALAREGGLESTLWAGPENISRRMLRGEVPVQGAGKRGEPVNLRLGFADEDIGYAIDIGLPEPLPFPTMFDRDPEIKRESIFAAPFYRPNSVLVERHNALVTQKQEKGEKTVLSQSLRNFDSMLTEVSDTRRAPEVARLRDMVRAWRFYDHFRADIDAPARSPSVGTRTPIIDADGRDLPAALQTIREIGDEDALAEAISDAFPGGSIRVVPVDGRLKLEFSQPGLLRPLTAAELSDGTLRYLFWVAALLTPRPPPLMVLNEPETSLHPDLLPALGRLIARAAKTTQVWVVSHARRLVSALEEDEACRSIELDKSLGQTEVAGRDPLDEPAWKWPAR